MPHISKYRKAVGAAVGGGVAGAFIMPTLPEGTPWYGYLGMYALSVLLPMLSTYITPKNSS